MNNPIYIIDDLKIIADLIQHTLELAGFKNCYSFENPTELLDIIAVSNDPALIITDFQMPEMNGIELLTKIVHHCPQTRGIIMTSDPRAAKKMHPSHPVLSKLSGTFRDELLVAVELAIGQKANYPMEFWAA